MNRLRKLLFFPLLIMGMLLYHITDSHAGTLSAEEPETVWTETKIMEALSDDMIVSRNSHNSSKEQHAATATPALFSFSGHLAETAATGYPPNLSTESKQEICFGLLFLQQLF